MVTLTTPLAAPVPSTASCDNQPLYVFVTMLISLINKRLDAEHAQRVQDSQNKPQSDADDEVDVVVVGGGSAGCVIAARLSEHLGVHVMLLDKGGTEPVQSRVPAFLSYINSAKVVEYLAAEPEPANCNGTGCTFYLPAVLGGGGALNGMLYVRGSPVDYDGWAERVADPGWNYANVLRYFKRSEDNQDRLIAADKRYHSTDGPLRVSWHPYRGPVLHRIAEAFRRVGLPFREDANARVQLGHTVMQTTTAGGERWSTYRAYLKPAMHRPNLRVITYATATRVLFESPPANATGAEALPRATAVEYRDAAGKIRVVKARMEVVITAGALHTPQILMLSGVGPAKQLQALNISVVADLPVGEGLQDQIRAGGFAFDCSSSLCESDWEHRKEDLELYERRRRGPLSATPGQITAFLRTDVDPPPPLGQGPPAKQPDLQIYVSGSREDGTGCVVLDRWRSNRFTLMPAVLHPRSRGSVRLRSTDPLAPPLVRFGFFTDDGDRDLAVYLEGLRLVLRMEAPLKAMGLTLSRDPALAPACSGSAFGSEAYLRCLARTTTGTTWHYGGTCPMGSARDRTAVVDSRLRVRGVKGLRLADASVMPTLPSGNTNAPTIMVAERAADLFREDHGIALKPVAKESD